MPSVTTKTTTRPPADAVDAVRRFNRFYTRRIHILDEAHLESDFSLAAVRVLYELAHRDAMSAADLGRELDLDAGYLSRILGDLGRRKLVTRQRATDDARVSRIRLTARGRARYAVLDARASDDIAALLAPLGEPSQRRLVAAMGAITAILDDDTSDRESAQRSAPPYLLRTHAPATSGGWCGGTACSTPMNTAGTSASRRSSRASFPTLSPISTPRTNGAGSPNA